MNNKVETLASVPKITTSTDAGFDLAGALGRVAGRKNVLIYMHDNPDPDSLAAALGLSRLLAHELGCKTTLGLGGTVGRAENRAMVEHLHIPLTPLDQVDPKDFDCFAIVDSQPGTGNNSVPTDLEIDIIVDHHPPRGTTPGPWRDIRESYGATSTMVYEYLRERGIALDIDLATGLFFALRTETRDLGREATEAERAAYLHLVTVADHDLLYKVSHPKVAPEYFAALDRALRSARIHDDIVVANLQDLAYPDLVAEVADLLLAHDKASYVLCAGSFKDRVHLSLRTELNFRKAGSLMRQIVANDGTAGGHGTMAGGNLFVKVASPEQLDTTFNLLVERLHKALGRKMPPPRDLCPPAAV